MRPGVGRFVRLPLVTQIQSDRLPAVIRGAGLRLLSVCLAVWALGMLSPRVTPHQAAVIVFVGAGVVIGVARAARSRHAADPAAPADRPGRPNGGRRGGAARAASARIGLLVLALGFFLFWTLVYLGVWWWHPAGAFTGLGPHPYFSDFFYYAVIDGVHLAARRHPRPLARRAHGDDGRDRDRRGAALGLPRVVRRPATADPARDAAAESSQAPTALR